MRNAGAGNIVLYILLLVVGVGMLDYYWFDIIDWLKGLM